MASHRGAVKVPKYNEYHWPVIRALKETGGSASIAELYERVIADMNLGEDVLAVPHGDGTTSEVEYRLAWARTYLKKVGAIDNSERGVWALTSKGRAFTEKDAADVVKQVRSQFRKQGQPEIVPSEEMEVKADEAEISWKESLLGVLKSMSPAGFERLSQRILRESGFTKVEVHGRSGDGGIDGAGVLRMNLVSFHVLFQCKRWKDAVSAPVVRDFRGAMIGRADKGLIITTGRFTSEAQREAVRDGAPAIDLVDGETLCEFSKICALAWKCAASRLSKSAAMNLLRFSQAAQRGFVLPCTWKSMLYPLDRMWLCSKRLEREEKLAELEVLAK